MSQRQRSLLLVAVAIVGATGVARLLGYKVGGNTVVRCRKGHLFTTLWIPGVKLKGLELGFVRLQRCPVGRHWSLIVPVKDSTLTDEERRSAAEHHDLWIP
jgi:hypothetical protein